MLVACGGEGDRALLTDGGEPVLEYADAGEGLDLLLDLGRMTDADADVAPEPDAGEQDGRGSLGQLLDRLEDKDAGEEPGGPDEPDVGQPEPDAATGSDPDPDPDPDAGTTDPEICQPCVEDSWIENYATVYGRGNCPEIENALDTTTGEFECRPAGWFPEVSGEPRCFLKIFFAEQCDAYPGMSKSTDSSVKGYCRPTGITCAEWLVGQP